MKFSITDFFSKCDQICSFLEKHDIISDVIIPIAAILKNIFYIFFVTLQSMTKPKFLSKTFSLCAPLPGAWSDKNTPGQIVLKAKLFVSIYIFKAILYTLEDVNTHEKLRF